MDYFVSSHTMSFSVQLSIVVIVLTPVWIRAEVSTFEDADREALLTYGFVPDSIEGSGLFEEQSDDKAEFFCPGSMMSLQHKKYILFTHNRLRSKLAFGQQPNKHGRMSSGRNIYFLRWDCDLELLAHQRIQSCSDHTLYHAGKFFGPQLVKHFDVRLHGNNVTYHIEDSLRSWWLQYKKYGNVDPKNRYSARQRYYAWASMAKGKTTRTGCSYSHCDGNRRGVFSCIYNERAHIERQPIYEHGKPCMTNDDCSTFPQSVCLSRVGLCKVPRKQKASQSHMICNEDNSRMTDECRRDSLDQHNFYRSRLAKGLEFNAETNSTAPGASGMLKMSYNCELERSAQSWADECIFEHSDRKSRPNQGQNLYMTSFVNLEPASVLHTAIEMWWKELEEFGMPADAILSEMTWISKGNLIGHFTQMAWSETHQVGCAIGNCTNMGLVVCHYSPAGNRRNRFIYKVGVQCAQEPNCPRGTICSENEGLCVIQRVTEVAL